MNDDRLHVHDSTSIVGCVADHDNRRDGTTENKDLEDDNISQSLSTPSNQDSKATSSPRETVASNASHDKHSTAGKVNWNNAEQARHWCFTFNNYSTEDLLNIKERLKKAEGGQIVSAVVGEEVGENGTPHLQAYIHFKKVMRQSGIHKFFGYSSPCMHLSVHGKNPDGTSNGKPPVASFQYCMKDDKYFTFGKNLDEITRIKDKTKAGTGRSNDNWSAITKAEK